MKELIDFFQDKNVATLLDVGTGPGNFIKVLKQAFPEASFTGVDPDTTSLEKAKEDFPDATFQKMTGEKLEFEDNTFDVASISMVLHHLSDVQKTLAEMKRVVKPGGWIVVNELFSDNLNPAQEVHKQMHHFRSKIDRMKGVVHNDSFTRKEILEQVEKVGMQIGINFDYKNPPKTVTKADIDERKAKLYEAVETIKDREEYEGMLAEIPEIEAELEKHGFEMATRLVVVGLVLK